MPKQIDKLTDSQRAAMVTHADHWITRALDTSPPDWDEWERGMRECYRFANLEPPKRVVRVPNPLVGALAYPIAAHIIENGDSVVDSVGDSVRDSVRGSVGGSVGGSVSGLVSGLVGHSVGDSVRGSVSGLVGGSVGGSVRDSVRDSVVDSVGGLVGGSMRGSVSGLVVDSVGDSMRGSVRNSVRGLVGGSVGDSVRGSVGDSVGDSVVDSVGDSVGDSVRDSVRGRWSQFIGGQWWDAYYGGGYRGYWGASPFTSFFRDVCGLEFEDDTWDRARAWERANTVGWWWPHSEFVMVCERPKFVRREQVGPRGLGSHRMHCEDGPAIAWEGWGLYFWHGLQVPAEAFTEPGWLTDNGMERITRERNAELRRAFMEMLPGGQAEYIRAAGGELLDKVHEPPFPGLIDAELWRMPNPDGGEEFTCVLCRNSTPEPDGSYKLYSLWVHPELRPLLPNSRFGEPQELTAHNALASTYGERGETYAPAVET